MCLAVPGRVVQVGGGKATVEVAEARHEVSLNLLSAAEMPVVGDYLVFHLGMALARIEPAEAEELMAMLVAVASIQEDPEEVAVP